ncbi:MAG: hypothetical protein HVN34_11005 [Methanobacteriaceae archaeon]|nr:hypothetical protein [Methanobacteriaceae archaeon]
MKSVEISGNIDYKKLISCLFWTNRIATRYVGCDSFLIQKIITKIQIYEANQIRYIKLSNNILEHVLLNIRDFELVEFYITLGEEEINITIQGNVFSVSTAKTKELEDEIISKIELEAKKYIPGYVLNSINE